jgi:hypothetical protein
MSTLVILSLIGIALFILISVALTLQTMEKNSKEKRHQETALKGRIRNFDHVLSLFPQGFLSPDLHLLICRCNMDANEQLAQLDSKNNSYASDAEAAQQRMSAAKTRPSAQKHIIIKEVKQIKEIQQTLSMLFTFVQSLQKSNRLSPPQSKIFCLQINQLVIQTATDGMLSAAKEAESKGKYRLAIHYHNTAIDKFKRENGSGAYKEKITQLQQTIEQLNKKAGSEPPISGADIDENAKEWDNIASDDNDIWKKKAVYD